MSRRVHIEVKVKLIVDMDEGMELDEFVNEMNYGFTWDKPLQGPDSATILDTEILDYEVKDSR